MANILFLIILLLTPYDQMSLDDLLKVKVTTATKKAVELQKAPASMIIITSDIIEGNGYNTLAEILDDEAGIYVNDDILNSDIAIRGVSGGMRGYSKGLKILINGLPIRYRINSTIASNLDFLPVEAIERIEIIKGPSSALYGANAFNGVINIITKKESNVSLKFIGKDIDYRGFEENLSFSSGNFFFTERFSNIDRSGISGDTLLSPFISDRLNENDKTSPIVYYVKFEEGGLLYDQFYQRTKSSGEYSDWGILTHNNTISYENSHFRLMFQKDFNIIDINIGGIYSYGSPTNEEHLFTGDTYYIEKDVAYKAFDGHIECGKRFAKVELLGGTDFSYDIFSLPNVYYIYPNGDKILDKRYPPAPQNDTTFINYGLYLHGSIDIIPDKVSITGGIRNDIHNIYKDFLSYRLGLILTPNDRSYIKLISASSFKAPPPNWLFSRPIKVYGGVMPNPLLKPEKAFSHEISAGYVFGMVSISSNIYYQSLTDKVELLLSGASYRPTNISSLSGWGYEGEIKCRFKHIQPYISVTYTYLNEQSGDQISMFPPIMVKCGFLINYKIFSFYTKCKYIDKILASKINRRLYGSDYYIPSYFTLDSGTDIHISTWQDRKIALHIDVNNIFNQKFVYGGFGGIDIPSKGRWIDISLNLNF